MGDGFTRSRSLSDRSCSTYRTLLLAPWRLRVPGPRGTQRPVRAQRRLSSCCQRRTKAISSGPRRPGVSTLTARADRAGCASSPVSAAGPGLAALPALTAAAAGTGGGATSEPVTGLRDALSALPLDVAPIATGGAHPRARKRRCDVRRTGRWVAGGRAGLAGAPRPAATARLTTGPCSRAPLPACAGAAACAAAAGRSGRAARPAAAGRSGRAARPRATRAQVASRLAPTGGSAGSAASTIAGVTRQTDDGYCQSEKRRCAHGRPFEQAPYPKQPANRRGLLVPLPQNSDVR